MIAIKPYKKIADYTGEIMDDDEWEKNPSDYGIQWSENETLDARSTQTGIARYANSCLKKDKENGKCSGNNTRLRRTKKGVILESMSRRIPAGSELLAKYGSAYWSK